MWIVISIILGVNLFKATYYYDNGQYTKAIYHMMWAITSILILYKIT